MNNDDLILAEWYDGWIPPRHHMAVVSYGNALIGLRKGYSIFIHPIDPEVLHGEQRAPVKRSSR